jgi:enamine deaminase RidA (YjgF/YER057c/UK114 family)
MTSQKITLVKTGSIYEEKNSYSRLMVVGDWILMSNTAGRNYATREISPDALSQARQAFHNVEAALASVGASLADVVRSRVAIPRLEDVAGVMEFVGEKFRGIDPVTTVTCTPLAGTDYLFEIELTAHRGAGLAEKERLQIVI